LGTSMPAPIKVSTVRRLTPMMRAARLTVTSLDTGGLSGTAIVPGKPLGLEAPLHPIDSAAERGQVSPPALLAREFRDPALLMKRLVRRTDFRAPTHLPAFTPTADPASYRPANPPEEPADGAEETHNYTSFAPPLAGSGYRIVKVNRYDVPPHCVPFKVTTETSSVEKVAIKVSTFTETRWYSTLVPSCLHGPPSS